MLSPLKVHPVPLMTVKLGVFSFIYKVLSANVSQVQVRLVAEAVAVVVVAVEAAVVLFQSSIQTK